MHLWSTSLRSAGFKRLTSRPFQVEGCEHQDNANIHQQLFPESVSEEPQIHTDYNGYHRHHIKRDSYLSAHFSTSEWSNCHRDGPSHTKIERPNCAGPIGIERCY